MLALSLSVPVMKAEGVTNPGTNTPIPPVSVPVKPNPKITGPRPQSPFEQFIEAYYDGETLSLCFARPEGLCNLTVVDNETNNIEWYYFDSNEETEIAIGEYWNSTILIDTSLGNSYIGVIK